MEFSLNIAPFRETRTVHRPGPQTASRAQLFLSFYKNEIRIHAVGDV
jgi:hypothetical protein